MFCSSNNSDLKLKPYPDQKFFLKINTLIISDPQHCIPSTANHLTGRVSTEVAFYNSLEDFLPGARKKNRNTFAPSLHYSLHAIGVIDSINIETLVVDIALNINNFGSNGNW